MNCARDSARIAAAASTVVISSTLIGEEIGIRRRFWRCLSGSGIMCSGCVVNYSPRPHDNTLGLLSQGLYVSRETTPFQSAIARHLWRAPVRRSAAAIQPRVAPDQPGGAGRGGRRDTGGSAAVGDRRQGAFARDDRPTISGARRVGGVARLWGGRDDRDGAASATEAHRHGADGHGRSGDYGCRGAGSPGTRRSGGSIESRSARCSHGRAFATCSGE